MPYTKVTRDQFESDKERVIHKPTGAWFSTYQGQTDISHLNWKNAGSVLPNGDDYDQDEIRQMAQRLLIERGPDF